uniref:GCN5-related N-acetyltransferase n=2 Tax=Candidatus Bipolaricaulota TaxID=67810 RepID=H5SKG9_9BACT|nr:GCN5-related N-acetyltransferase [uncultured Acetothermia bacterium]BAL59324.1 GCN5-related N-acetyltransferase [Candidatus Acetothermum autotrophicum]
MNFQLREFTVNDYPAIAQIGNAIYPDYRYSPEEIQYDDEHFDRTKYIFKRYVAEVNNQVVGYAEYNHMPHMFHPQKFWVYVGVHPDFQRQGIGTALYEKIVSDLIALKAVRAFTSAREDYPRSVAFLQKNGFSEIRRTWESRLAVKNFDLSQFAHYLERFFAHGLTITTLADELKRDPESLRKLHELYVIIMEDVPHPDQYTPVDFEHFLRYSIEHPDAIAEGYFIAKDGEKYIGLSNLRKSKDEPKDLYQGLTGVQREYRGQGVAMALKLKTIEYARTHGYEVIKTWNDSDNVGMLTINEKLGFVRQPAWITFAKEFSP